MLKILHFLEKRPLTVTFQNFVPKILVVKFGRREIVRCLADQKQNKNKISPSSPADATAWIAPKICQGQPPTM